MPNTIKTNSSFPQITLSNRLYDKAERLIPSGTQTLAKGPGQYTKGIAPKFIHKGKGSHVWDADGNEYIDYNMGIGPVSLGYCYEKVDNAIIEQLKSGITFSMMHPLEVEVAEMINRIIPNAESVRFSKTGCDVTSAAVRLARAFTGRDKILCCGYHGWHDWYISTTDRSAGIPQSTKDLVYTFDYNNIDSAAEAIDSTVAAVILEPVVFEEPRDNFLHNLKELCQKNGVLLIFDEMWTGFRLHLGGAQEYYGVKADLACFSKAIANGMPLSVLTGRADVMKMLEKDVFFYTTFGGEALSLAAAKAVISEMSEKDVTSYLSYQGSRLKAGYNEIAENLGMEYTGCFGHNARCMIKFNVSAGEQLELKTLMQQEMFKRGILWSGFHNISYSHTDEDILYTLKAYEEVLTITADAVEDDNVKSRLKGEVIEPVFRKTSNFHTKPKTGAAA